MINLNRLNSSSDWTKGVCPQEIVRKASVRKVYPVLMDIILAHLLREVPEVSTISLVA